MENFSSDSKTLKDSLEQDYYRFLIQGLNVENVEKLIKYICFL